MKYLRNRQGVYPSHLGSPGKLSLVHKTRSGCSAAWVSDAHQIGSLGAGLSKLTHCVGGALHSMAERLNLPLLGVSGDQGSSLSKNLQGRASGNIESSLRRTLKV